MRRANGYEVSVFTGGAGLVSALAFLLLSACSGDSIEPAATHVRDSAGVVIVKNSLDESEVAASRVVAGAPALVIGGGSEDPDQQLYRARNAVRLSDGRIVVANSGMQELRIYDSHGRHLRTVGRQGEGPGEFMGLSWLGRGTADSLVTFDWRLRRVSLFDADGEMAASLSLTQVRPDLSVNIVGRFPSGALLALGSKWQSEMEAGLARDSVLFLVLGPRGEEQAAIDLLPGALLYTEIRKIGSQGVPVTTAALFTPQAFGRVCGEYACLGSTDRHEVRVYDPRGRLRRIVRAANLNFEVTAEDVRRRLEWRLRPYLNSGDEWPRALVSVTRAAPVPEMMPAILGVIVGADGTLWIEDYPRPGDDRPVWRALSAEGRLLESVSLPPGLEALDFGPGYVLARAGDELGIERIELYELEQRAQ